MSAKKKTIFPVGSIPYKMLEDLKNVFRRKAKINKKTVLSLLPLLMFAWFGNKIYYTYRLYGFTSEMMTELNKVFANPVPSLYKSDLLAGLVTAAAVGVFLHFKKKNKKNYRDKEEYGSARWGNAKDIEPYVDFNNPMLTVSVLRKFLSSY